jgi:hypothetical protein
MDMIHSTKDTIKGILLLTAMNEEKTIAHCEVISPTSIQSTIFAHYQALPGYFLADSGSFSQKTILQGYPIIRVPIKYDQDPVGIKNWISSPCDSDVSFETLITMFKRGPLRYQGIVIKYNRFGTDYFFDQCGNYSTNPVGAPQKIKVVYKAELLLSFFSALDSISLIIKLQSGNSISLDKGQIRILSKNEGIDKSITSALNTLKISKNEQPSLSVRKFTNLTIIKFTDDTLIDYLERGIIGILDKTIFYSDYMLINQTMKTENVEAFVSSVLGVGSEFLGFLTSENIIVTKCCNHRIPYSVVTLVMHPYRPFTPSALDWYMKNLSVYADVSMESLKVISPTDFDHKTHT